MKFIKLFVITSFLLFLDSNYAENKSAETKNNFFIKYFCIESVKSEFKETKITYKDTIGEEICNCYLNNLSNKISHQEAIYKCKLDHKKKNNL